MLTSPGGTRRFMAPELVTGEGKATEACDVWSFASLCYEVWISCKCRAVCLNRLVISQVLTNKLPFHQYKSDIQILSAMMRKETPRRPEQTDGEDSESSKELDEKVWGLLVRCWNYDPPRRPNCEAIQEALKDVGFQDTRPDATTKLETGSSFWQAMREKSSYQVDYQRVAAILLPVSSRPSFRL